MIKETYNAPTISVVDLKFETPVMSPTPGENEGIGRTDYD